MKYSAEATYECDASHGHAPLIPAGSSLAATLAFYIDGMGFHVVWQGGSMAGIARDGVEFNLVENHSREWAENASFSIGVSDVEGFLKKTARPTLFPVPVVFGARAVIWWIVSAKKEETRLSHDCACWSTSQTRAEEFTVHER